MNKKVHTLIIGAGIVGCSTAYYLAKFWRQGRPGYRQR